MRDHIHAGEFQRKRFASVRGLLEPCVCSIRALCSVGFLVCYAVEASVSIDPLFAIIQSNNNGTMNEQKKKTQKTYTTCLKPFKVRPTRSPSQL